MAKLNKVYVQVSPQQGERGVIFKVYTNANRHTNFEIIRSFGQSGQAHLDAFLETLRDKGYDPILETKKRKPRKRQTFGGASNHGRPGYLDSRETQGRRSSKKIDDRKTSTSDLIIMNPDGAFKPGATYLVPRGTGRF